VAELKPGLHPRSRHRARYDFPELVRACPELAAFVAVNPYGDASIDFANPEAVKALNRAILKHDYGVAGWDLPPGYLCPPIPGRADYLHHAADLLAADLGGTVPRGPGIRVLDLGVGANCVYPIIGHAEYGWSFLGSDIDRAALANAGRILKANPGLAAAVKLRLQGDPGQLFRGLLQPGENFALVVCNPPFHGSAQEAMAGSERKWRNLGKAGAGLNFGGQDAELWCPGGEAGFIGRMISESAAIPERCVWFSTLLAKSANLATVRAALGKAGALETRIIPMAQGQKQSRIVAWTFLVPDRRRARLAE
jgi:23S rRNA (adenine1618-N6)-methyltransferase